MVKVTFTLDEATVDRIRMSARRLSRPQSAVVREAVHDYALRIGRLSEVERRALLRTFDRVVARIPRRPLSEAEREIEDIRHSRRQGGRRSRPR